MSNFKERSTTSVESNVEAQCDYSSPEVKERRTRKSIWKQEAIIKEKLLSGFNRQTPACLKKSGLGPGLESSTSPAKLEQVSCGEKGQHKTQDTFLPLTSQRKIKRHLYQSLSHQEAEHQSKKLYGTSRRKQSKSLKDKHLIDFQRQDLAGFVEQSLVPHSSVSKSEQETSSIGSNYTEDKHKIHMTESLTSLLETQRRRHVRRNKQLRGKNTVMATDEGTKINLNIADRNRAHRSSNETLHSSDAVGRIDLTMHSNQNESLFLSQRSISVCAQASMSSSPLSLSLASKAADNSTFEKRRKALNEEETKRYSKNESRHSSGPNSEDISFDQVVFKLGESKKTRKEVGSMLVSPTSHQSTNYSIHPNQNIQLQKSHNITTSKDNKDRKSFCYPRFQNDLKIQTNQNILIKPKDSQVKALKLRDKQTTGRRTSPVYHKNSPDKRKGHPAPLGKISPSLISSIPADAPLSTANTVCGETRNHKLSPRESNIDQQTSIALGSEKAALEREATPDLTVPKMSLCSPQACRLHGSDVRHCLCENRPVHHMVTHQQYTMEELRHAGYSFYKDEMTGPSCGGGNVVALRCNATAVVAGDKGEAASWNTASGLSSNAITDRGGTVFHGASKKNVQPKEKPWTDPTETKQRSDTTKRFLNKITTMTRKPPINKINTTLEASTTDGQRTQSRQLSKQTDFAAERNRHGNTINGNGYVFPLAVNAVSKPQAMTKREMMKQIKEKIKQENQTANKSLSKYTRIDIIKKQSAGVARACHSKNNSKNKILPQTVEHRASKPLTLSVTGNHGFRSGSLRWQSCGPRSGDITHKSKHLSKHSSASATNSVASESKQNKETDRFHFGKLRSPQITTEKNYNDKTVYEPEVNEYTPWQDEEYRKDMQRNSQWTDFKNPNVSSSNNMASDTEHASTNFLHEINTICVTGCGSEDVGGGLKFVQRSFKPSDVLDIPPKENCIDLYLAKAKPALKSGVKVLGVQGCTKDTLRCKGQACLNAETDCLKENKKITNLISREPGANKDLPSQQHPESRQENTIIESSRALGDACYGVSDQVDVYSRIHRNSDEKPDQLQTAADIPKGPVTSKQRVSAPKLKTLARSRERQAKQNQEKEDKESDQRKIERDIKLSNQTQCKLKRKSPVPHKVKLVTHVTNKGKNIEDGNNQIHKTPQNIEDKLCDTPVKILKGHNQSLSINKSEGMASNVEQTAERKTSVTRKFAPKSFQNARVTFSRSKPGKSRFTPMQHGNVMNKISEEKKPTVPKAIKAASQHMAKPLYNKDSLKEKAAPTGFKIPDTAELNPGHLSTPVSRCVVPLSDNIPLIKLTNPNSSSQGVTLEDIRDSSMVLTCTEIDCPETTSYRKTKISWSISPERAGIRHHKQHIGRNREAHDSAARQLSPALRGTVRKLDQVSKISTTRFKNSDKPAIDSVRRFNSHVAENGPHDDVPKQNKILSTPSVFNVNPQPISDRMESENAKGKVTIKQSIPEFPEITSEEAEKYKLPESLPQMIGGTDISDYTSTAKLESSLRSKSEKLPEISTTASRYLSGLNEENTTISGKGSLLKLGVREDEQYLAIELIENQPGMLTKMDNNRERGKRVHKSHVLVSGSLVSIADPLGESDPSLGGMVTPEEESPSRCGLSEMAVAAADQTVTDANGAVRSKRSLAKMKSNSFVAVDPFEKLRRKKHRIELNNNLPTEQDTALGKVIRINIDTGQKEFKAKTDIGGNLVKGSERVRETEVNRAARKSEAPGLGELTRSKSQSQSQSQSHSHSRSHKSSVDDSATNTLERLVRRRLVSGRSHKRFGGSNSPRPVNVTQAVWPRVQKPSTTISGCSSDPYEQTTTAVGVPLVVETNAKDFLKRPKPRSRSLFSPTGYTEDSGYVASAAHHSIRQRGLPIQPQQQWRAKR